MTRAEFIETYANQAIKATAGSGIFPQTLLTMAIVESADSNGRILKGATVKYNNLFGIKSSPDWNGKTVRLKTKNDSTKTSVFRVYDSFSDSFKDYVNFLKSNKRYKEAGVFKAQDYILQLGAIARAGYAENPRYFSILSSVAEVVNKFLPVAKNSKAGLYLLAFAAAILIINSNDEKP